MNKEEMNMLGFQIVAYAGDARSSLLKLIREVRNGEFQNVETLLADADTSLKQAHNAQTEVLAKEAGGEDVELGFIFIHGQDHLMTTILLRELAEDFVNLYQEKYAK
ncbi:PTS lactose/cellobiose transporter subunit IIA [Enterococcus dispar]|jgi:PTS system lactose-specific IIA component|uniref:PTS system lactose-specific EIIA component n=1 Tax=Enterococcus dispar ATCC 51266 TaxID=1139219 RepID=S1NCW3_9ENTE|nr:PTS lactose/cellobiose transporter subunit IIA [Enterococcus dispar]EOT41471.1 PTS system lactose/cellobiose-specific IIA component [Enterococcus dispar ATCC 51266]EOW86895.1 PTS system lactose/cellobiose-specific IIA component [Enterococcus dispar ATCC 51266]MCU7357802.1 PTS lactose/cellobiose transporter subunit IIA [Enterococcus dispar]MDT2706191.1 PTS lactose/cellobiose transporter subunit IIA [Enterococcus dispar]OJG39841.1 PTS system lactose/cellobiose-specific IIA component [Enteroco